MWFYPNITDLNKKEKKKIMKGKKKNPEIITV